MPIHIPSPNAKRRARIEIVPLIDIVFFLLATFVMVSLSMVKSKGIPVTLPGASTGTPQPREDFATVTIAADGALFFDKQAVTLEQLGAAMKAFAEGRAEPRVFINGDAKAELGVAIAVLDKARALGITRMAFETRPVAPTP